MVVLDFQAVADAMAEDTSTYPSLNFVRWGVAGTFCFPPMDEKTSSVCTVCGLGGWVGGP